MGPSGIGKSLIVVDLCKHFYFNVISVDSTSIYKYMDIGTAKPTKKELDFVNYFLINILDPKEKYSVAEFYFDSLKIIENSFVNNKISLFVGGTMMYFWVLKNGLYLFNFSEEKKLYFYKKFLSFNSLFFDEYSYYYRKSINSYFLFSNVMNKHKIFNSLINYDIISIIIVPNTKETLFDKIEIRLSQMFKLGFLEEVNNLYLRGDLSSNMQSIKSIGYRQIWNYLSGNISLCDAKKDIFCSTKLLVKRQLTWLKKWNKYTYVFFESDKNLLDKIKYVISGNGI